METEKQSMKSKRISAQAIMALKDALANIFWKKEDLRKFIEFTIENSAIVATVDWTLQKFESVSSLIDRMATRQDIYQDDLLKLFYAVGNFDDFSHLAYWDKDKGGQLTRRAKDAVQRLRSQTKGYFDKIEEKNRTEANRSSYEQKIRSTVSFSEKLESLKSLFLAIATENNPQQRGFKLEKLLTELFHLFDLDAKGSFKIIGEQIDGSFTFDSQDYLLEAKWQKDPVNASDLYAFGGKIDGKFKSTVGLFISLDGFSKDCTQTGSSIIKSMILMDGADLMLVLDGRIKLNDMILIKRRHASDTGEIYFKISA